MSTTVYSGNSFVIIIFVAIIISLILFFMSKRPMAQKIVISIIPIVISLCIVKLISLANEKLDGSSKTIFENTKACNETSHDLNKNNLVANDSDFEEFSTLFENISVYEHLFEYSSADSSAYQTLLVKLLAAPSDITPLYYFFYEKHVDIVTASNGQFKDSPGSQLDPLSKFGGFHMYGKVNADEIDWIIKNVFGVTPNRDNATIIMENECHVYYYENYYYFMAYEGGFIGGSYEIRNKEVDSNNVYTIEIDYFYVGNDPEYEGTYKIVCALKNIDGKRQWTFSSIEKIEKEEKNTQSTTATTSKKETTTKKTNKTVTVKEVTKNKEWYSDDGKLLARVGCTYPKITIVGNKSASDKINNYISNSSFYHHVLDCNINKCFTEEYGNELKKDYKNLLSKGSYSWTDGDAENIRYSIRVEYYNDKYISLCCLNFVKPFTAFTSTNSVNGLVFDINTGELLSFSDMFNSRNKFIDIINSYLNKNHSETMNNRFEFTGDSDYTGRPNWLLSEEGLVVYNNEFGTSQVPQYKIPYSLVGPYLKDEYSE